MMKPKERIIAALKGMETDRVCWSPNPAYWWEAQNDEFVNKGEYEFLVDIGADPVFRGHYPMHGRAWENMSLFGIKYNRCSLRESMQGEKKLLEYVTPVGKLKFVYSYSLAGNTWFLEKHGVQTEEDFKTLACLMDDIKVDADYKRFNEKYAEYGENSLFIALLCPFAKSGFQSMVEYWVGTEEIAYALVDYPEVVEEALEAMKRVNLETVRISAGSKAEAFLTFEDTSTTNISPQYYSKYILPEIESWCDLLHDAGKLYIQHACGHVSALLPHMARAGIDCIESISPPPTGNIELWDARKKLPENVALIGGIEPTVFKEYELKELEDYVLHLLDQMKGSRFILGNSDSCPPGVSLEKFRRITELVRAYR
jgi:hypothetical protein